MSILQNIEKLIEQKIKERVATPIMAKIDRHSPDSYTCDCIELTNDGQETDTIYTRVEIPKLLASKDGGIFFTPNKGTIVLINFLNGDRNYPIISAVMGTETSYNAKENTMTMMHKDTEIALGDVVTIKAGTSEIVINKSGTIDIKNSNNSLAKLIKDIVSDISTVKTVDGKPLSPDDILKLQALSIKIDGLLGG